MRFCSSDLKEKARQKHCLTCGFNGAPGAIRTRDTRFRRAVLYPLSYGGMRGYSSMTIRDCAISFALW